MADFHLAIGGVRATAVKLFVPQGGAWVADVDIDADTAVTGKTTVAIGAASFVGTVDPGFSGAFQLRRSFRVVGGANGWGNAVKAKAWHSDGGVTDRSILVQTAAECGETFEQAGTTRVGADWGRQAGPGSETLRRLAPAWFVGYDGVTRPGPRVVGKLGKVDLLNFDPRENVAELAAEDVTAVQVGHVLTDRLEAPFTVRQIEIRIEGTTSRIWAWGTT